MRRFLKRVRRPSRWPEEIHMMIGGGVTIALIFGLVFLFAKIGEPPKPAAAAATDGARK